MISWQRSRHSRQIRALGPAAMRLASVWALPQKLHVAASSTATSASVPRAFSAPVEAAAAAERAAEPGPADALANGVEVDVRQREHLRRDPLALAEQREQQVLAADVRAAVVLRLANREVEHLLRARGEVQRLGGVVGAAAEDPYDRVPCLVEVEPGEQEHAGGDGVLGAEQAEQQVLGAERGVPERPGLLLGERDRLPGVGEQLAEQLVGDLGGRDALRGSFRKPAE
jgi:hypothetical protein